MALAEAAAYGKEGSCSPFMKRGAMERFGSFPRDIRR